MRRDKTQEEGPGHERGEGVVGLLEENEIQVGCSDLRDCQPEA